MRTMLMAALLAVACVGPASAGGGTYGGEMPTGEAVPLGIALRDVHAHAEKPAKFSGRITEVCQAKGCWMVLADGDELARVVMKDHAFAVPADASGEAVVHGTLSAVEVGEDAAAHLREDGAAVVAEREYRIEANAVQIGETAR